MLRAVRYVVPKGAVGCWVPAGELGDGSRGPAIIGGIMSKHGTRQEQMRMS